MLVLTGGEEEEFAGLIDISETEAYEVSSHGVISLVHIKNIVGPIFIHAMPLKNFVSFFLSIVVPLSGPAI